MEQITEEKVKHIIIKNRERISLLGNKLDCSFIEVDESLLLAANDEGKSSGSDVVNVTIGFPFPIGHLVLKIDSDFSADNRYRYIVRGDIIRELQHKSYLSTLLADKLIYHYNIENSIEQFYKKVRKDIGLVNKMLYVDPHNHDNGTNIGDSFISLYYPKAFLSSFHALEVDVYTRSYQHLHHHNKLTFYEYEELKTCNFEHYDLIVISDFIDVNSTFTCEILQRLSVNNRFKVILNGRNSYFSRKSNELFHFKYHKSDPILIDKGIEDYMQDCCSPFINNDDALMRMGERKLPKNVKVVFINPFTSKEKRDLTPEMISNLIYSLSETIEGAVFYISRGLNQNKEKEWIKSFIDLGVCAEYRFCDAMQNLNQLGAFINDQCDICISADTAVVHACIERQIPCITIYRMSYFNLFSVQSIAEIFTRKSPFLVPMALYDDWKSESDIIDAIKILLKIKTSTIAFDRRAYRIFLNVLYQHLHKLEQVSNQDEYEERIEALNKIISDIENLFSTEIKSVIQHFNYTQLLQYVIGNYNARYLVSYICKCSLLTKMDNIL
ncbi:hypothetical protein [Cedecea neteri]|uniref:hypothetical protein n=1 Tax=Cedecea neteri TaxID=158822 RepID=UPI0004F86E3C|nr:hypothetical protein [Cedecea neteri]AIR64302.1 hypothetical protein LH86_04155 [Cedecea neteri]